MWNDFQRLASAVSPDDPACFEALTDKLPPLRHIWISRRDKVRQAVSLAKATQTGVWRVERGTDPPERTGDLRIGQLDDYVRRLTRQDVNWKQFFESLDIEPLRIEYETLAAEYELTMRRVLEYLGVAVNSVPPPRLKRQADASSEEWVARYRSRISDRPADL
jgi:LPS sulfotransferase NodH